MHAPDFRGEMLRGRVVSAVLPSPRKRARFIAPLARKTSIAWWEFESEIKRRLALEILMRKLFSLEPEAA